jgi:hypothetical protein
MPVDIAKAYLEIQQLRQQVRKAELALRISFARSASRPRHPGRTNAPGSRAANPKMPVLKRGQS